MAMASPRSEAYSIYEPKASTAESQVTQPTESIIMKASKTSSMASMASMASVDPICGMAVDAATAIHAERAGKTFYFCGETCRKKFMLLAPGKLPESKPTGCCG